MTIVNSVYKYFNSGYWTDRKEGDIEKIVVHHSAIAMDKSKTDDELLTQIMNVHVNNGWAGLSYHYVICPNGNIHKCNEHTDITWHDTINSDSLAILVCGYFHPPINDKPTEQQLASLKELLDFLCTENPQIPADQDDVVGHRDRSATACPGDILYKYVQDYRNNLGNVEWFEDGSLINCEKKLEEVEKELDDMRESRNKWKNNYQDLSEDFEEYKKEKTDHIESIQKTVSEQNLMISTQDKRITLLDEENKSLREALVTIGCSYNELKGKNDVLSSKLEELQTGSPLESYSRWELVKSFFRKR